MVCCSIKRNGKIYYKNVSDNWWNVYLNRARFENLPIKKIFTEKPKKSTLS